MRALPFFRRRSVRRAATVLVVVILVVSAWLGGRQTDTIRAERDTATGAAETNASSVDTVGNKILPDVCKAATAKRLQAIGRLDECELATQGKIDEVVPVVTPSPAQVEQVSEKDIERVVDAYLADYLTDLPAKYRADLRAEVVSYLTRNPPKAGQDGKPGPPPSPAAIAAAVASYLTAHPPVPGKDGTAGADGVSVTGAALDGCDLVFSLSDDTSVRVGPICGPKGEKGDGPTAAELRAAFDAYCADQPGGTCKGTEGTPGYPTGWRQADGSVCTDPDGDRFYTCEAPPPPSTPPPSDPPASIPATPDGKLKTGLR
jgi:hypothetical protein